MEKEVVIQNGLFYDGSTKEEINVINSLYPKRKIIIHMILPGVAHITLLD